MSIDFLYGNELYSYYGILLTEHQQDVLSDYYENDYSMQEIAENFGISKAAVSDLISRCSKQMLDYENKLGLIAKDKKRGEILQKMSESRSSAVRKYAVLLNNLEEDKQNV
ncbi:MAG: sigma factor-like helix-turn-helix DNA-binding protein [Erysipelotrichaceae bacterium]|nr:sigma factor-like helix-turn-helix DNA-binding protein [Erysipelotrichaceae bacterium]